MVFKSFFHTMPAVSNRQSLIVWLALGLFVCVSVCDAIVIDDGLSPEEMKLVQAAQRHRIDAVNQVIGSVIAIYDDDRQGGGSGVIIDPSGIALTNHHVIVGSGVEGWGGLADGKLYKWKLIGTDPGGDVSIIQMEGRDDFPFTPLGDSDRVRVGDWALAMGNPFILTEDQSPTVTLGIVSGVKRYQPGAGLNQLVYGNCIQVDSSINPGNSGGPLFNFNGEVIGINGRGSFKERGRVNVGLGYAISANQIKNFIPDLLATKLVEHATLDASFTDRDGKVLCSQVNLDAAVGQAGLNAGDELLEFEGQTIHNANQFTNLICTLPEDWPAQLTIRKKNGQQKNIVVRTYGLPYRKPPKPKQRPGNKRDPEEEQKQKKQRQMVELLAAPSGKVRIEKTNLHYTRHTIKQWKSVDGPTGKIDDVGVAKMVADVIRDDQTVGSQTLWLAADGRFRIESITDEQTETYIFDGQQIEKHHDGETESLSLVQAKLNQTVSQAISMIAVAQQRPFEMLGKMMLDGGDKAAGGPAFRMKIRDKDDDPFYVWLKMYDDEGHAAPRLVKSSADKDCGGAGGVTFSDWRDVGPLKLPFRREFVSGLQEEPSLALVNRSSTWLQKFDESQFKTKLNAGTDVSHGNDDGDNGVVESSSADQRKDQP